jgi:ligand-binding sensor protein
MDGIAVLTRAFVTIYADDFHPLKPFGATQQQNTKNIFCRNVKTQYHAKCTQSDVNAFKNFPENENFYYYRCHCGFIEIACRFYSNNTVLGYLLIGPFRDPLTEEKDVERINHLCEEHGFNRDEMLRSYYQIEPFSEEVFLALKNICPPLFDYYDMKNYISEKAYNVDAERFFNFYQSKGWYVGKNKMKDWKAAVRTWVIKDKPKGFETGITLNNNSTDKYSESWNS